jgi:uncharacterized protein YacL
MIPLENLTQQDVLIFLGILFLAVVAMVATRRLLQISFPYFFMGILGLVVGLWVGSRLGVPFATLPAPYGRWVPLVINVVIAVAILDLFLAQARPIAHFFGRLAHMLNGWLSRVNEPSRPSDALVIDTSGLIDGRLEEIARAGFIEGVMIVPKFVLHELQGIADHPDPMKRTRGRRGLDVLANLQKIATVDIQITDDLANRNEEVDAKVILLAKQRGAKIVTVDYNLNRVAQIQGVTVLNINELATALRPNLIPGESLPVQVIQKGKERGQGVGYLPDGTMIVVEGGARYLGEMVECEVIRIFQSVAGKMIFVEPKSPGGEQSEEA